MWVHAADPEQLEPFYMSVFYTPVAATGERASFAKERRLRFIRILCHERGTLRFLCRALISYRLVC